MAATLRIVVENGPTRGGTRLRGILSGSGAAFGGNDAGLAMGFDGGDLRDGEGRRCCCVGGAGRADLGGGA